MKTILTFSVLLLLAACGVEGDASDNTEADRAASSSQTQQTENALYLTPTIEAVGLDDVFEMLDVTHLAFDAELFLIPLDIQDGVAGDAVSLQFNFEDGEQTKVVANRAIRLLETGTYRVLLRVRRSENGVSVDIGGFLSGPIVARLQKAEPAPTAASGKDEEPAPTAAQEKCEPAPTAADGGDGSDEGSDDDDDACEPAPTAADEDDEAGEAYEPAPTAAAESEEPPNTEPAPTAAEPAPTPAREKATIDELIVFGDDEVDAELVISTRQEFEFYAGMVDVSDNDETLRIRWDVRDWLRNVLAAPLGLSRSDIELTESEFLSEPGFSGSNGAFEIDSL